MGSGSPGRWAVSSGIGIEDDVLGIHSRGRDSRDLFDARSGTGKSENVFKIYSGFMEYRGMGCK